MLSFKFTAVFLEIYTFSWDEPTDGRRRSVRLVNSEELTRWKLSLTGSWSGPGAGLVRSQCC